MSTAGRWRALLGREAAQALVIDGGNAGEAVALAQAVELLDFRKASEGLGRDQLQTYVTPITVTRLRSSRFPCTQDPAASRCWPCSL